MAGCLISSSLRIVAQLFVMINIVGFVYRNVLEIVYLGIYDYFYFSSLSQELLDWWFWRSSLLCCGDRLGGEKSNCTEKKSNCSDLFYILLQETLSAIGGNPTYCETLSFLQ